MIRVAEAPATVRPTGGTVQSDAETVRPMGGDTRALISVAEGEDRQGQEGGEGEGGEGV